MCFQLPDGELPEWVPLIPKPDDKHQVNGRDGRSWLHDDPQRVLNALQALNAHGRDLVLDWEHATELKAPKGEQAPAAGWFREFRILNGELQGKLALNARGRESVANKEYRYVSPVLVYEADTRRIVDIASVALTNKHNLLLPALNHQQTPEKPMLEELLKALGLAADATKETALNAVKALNEKVTALNAERDTLNGKLQTALNSAQTPSLEKFVPRGDYDKALERANNAEQKLGEKIKSESEASIALEVDAALKAGKITPATKEYHLAQCRQEGGLERFREFVKAAPVIGDPSKLATDPPVTTASALNAEQKKVLTNLGITEEQFNKAKEAA